MLSITLDYDSNEHPADLTRENLVSDDEAPFDSYAVRADVKARRYDEGAAVNITRAGQTATSRVDGPAYVVVAGDDVAVVAADTFEALYGLQTTSAEVSSVGADNNGNGGDDEQLPAGVELGADTGADPGAAGAGTGQQQPGA